MSNLSILTVLIVIFALILGYANYWYYQAKKLKEITQLLQQENGVLTKELENAKKRNQLDAESHRLNPDDIDQFLQNDGYFRD